MATLILNCSSAANTSFKQSAKLQITYTASNGSLNITEIKGMITNESRFFDESLKRILVSINGTDKTISLDKYVDFDTNWVTWGATDVSWTGLTGTSIDITAKVPSSAVFENVRFEGNATMSWSKHTISYNANGGSNAPLSQTYTYGDTFIISNEKPMRTGYTFSEWNTKSDGSGLNYKAGSTQTCNGNLVLYAIWKINTYTISYNANGGSNAPLSQTKVYNKPLILSDVKPIKTGYVFKEWNTFIDGSGVTYEAGTNYTEDSDIVLYAIWNELAGFKNKVITIGSLKALHDYNGETFETKENVSDLISLSEEGVMEMVEGLLETKFDKPENDIIPIEYGGTNSTDGAIGLANLFASGETILSSYQYGDELPAAGNVGRIFFKRLAE